MKQLWNRLLCLMGGHVPVWTHVLDPMKVGGTIHHWKRDGRCCRCNKLMEKKARPSDGTVHP